MKTLDDVVEALKAGVVIEKVWNENSQEPEFWVNDAEVVDPDVYSTLYIAFYEVAFDRSDSRLRVEEMDYPITQLFLV